MFRLSYPKNWTYQILRPEVKNGHTLENPKLRGIAVSSMSSTVYDIMLDNHFKVWYKINRGLGCLVQILARYLLIKLAKLHGETIFIGYIDYEKAFDFTNRADIVKDLMVEKAGSIFTKAVSKMYQETSYVPKITGGKKRRSNIIKHGVTQGRKTSTSFFSFAVRNIPKAIKLP